MFLKLNKPFKNITYVKGSEFVSYGGIISYSDVGETNAELFDVVPEKYKNSFSLSLMEILSEVPPHTDSNVKTVINFYMNSGRYKTVFFDGDSDWYQVANQTNGKVFDRNGLVENGSFIAHDGDAFCMDVSKIHAVDSLDGNPETRIAVCLSTEDYNFEQVCDMLYETRCIN
jgi:hypothetical protein